MSMTEFIQDKAGDIYGQFSHGYGGGHGGGHGGCVYCCQKDDDDFGILESLLFLRKFKFLQIY